MIKTYKYKLYNSKKNKYLHSQINLACEIYNHFIAVHKRYYRLYGKTLHIYKLHAHITKLKKLAKYTHWKVLNAQVICDITKRIDLGYKKFFKKENKSLPTFKKRSNYKSITFNQNGYNLLGNNKIRIQNKEFKYFKSRELEGVIKTVTIKRDLLGDLYISFICKVEEIESTTIMTGKTAGFDFGLKTFLTSSDNLNIDSPLFYKQNINELKKASKQLSSKKRGSNNRKKARLNLTRTHKKITNRRLDYQHKLAKELSEEYDYLFFEDLNIEGMRKLWGRKISDLGFSNFIEILNHHCNKRGSSLTFIDRWFPSSKTCSVCGTINKELTLKDRTWECKNCKTNLDRDLNAAINIKRVGTSTLGLEDVRSACAQSLLESRIPAL